MNWYIFAGVALIAFFCGVHAKFAQMWNHMAAEGIDTGAASNLLRASAILMPIVNLNLLAFLIVFGIEQGWSVALLTVLGGWAVSIAMTFVMLKTGIYWGQVATSHRASWTILPALSIAIWLILYGIIPLDSVGA